jgi:mRNA interferase MazF
LNFKPTDIVTLNLPFSDLVGSKLRPVLVISSDKFNKDSNDVIVLKITGSFFHTDWEIEITNNDLIGGKLKKRSYIDTGFIFTVEKSIIHNKIGEISLSMKDRVSKKLIEIIAIR